MLGKRGEIDEDRDFKNFGSAEISGTVEISTPHIGPNLPYFSLCFLPCEFQDSVNVEISASEISTKFLKPPKSQDHFEYSYLVCLSICEASASIRKSCGAP